jgi:hypothetical protein
MILFLPEFSPELEHLTRVENHKMDFSLYFLPPLSIIEVKIPCFSINFYVEMSKLLKCFYKEKITSWFLEICLMSVLIPRVGTGNLNRLSIPTYIMPNSYLIWNCDFYVADLHLFPQSLQLHVFLACNQDFFLILYLLC